MCLCNGKGGIQVVRSWGVEFHPCPDSHCEHEIDDSALEELERKIKEAKRSDAYA